MTASDPVKMLGNLLHDHVVVMQAAWIEWQHGAGAETAMQWIENTLVCPGLLPDDPDEPYATDAQRYYNLNRSEPWPPCCICDGPTHIGIGGGRYVCSNECEAKAQEQQP